MRPTSPDEMITGNSRPSSDLRRNSLPGTAACTLASASAKLSPATGTGPTSGMTALPSTSTGTLVASSGRPATEKLSTSPTPIL